MIGKTLAHYEITDQLGRGGMGEVYRARDGKLDRDVAIKILPQDMSGDPERVARFQREARTLASLQHANIASIYGFEDEGGVRFLVMELVEGEDLSQRIERGALPREEAFGIALQIATGLEIAHEQNIVHRDLKPANIKLAADGQVKILDFGLARAYAGTVETQSDPSLSPTITAAMTQAGTILGTAAYMSPEQARGKIVDRRADIWAFGCVLYEMLVGKSPFGGSDITDVIASVVKSEPNWDSLPDDTPPRIRELLWRCLHKDPRMRLRDIGEAIFVLGEPDADPVHLHVTASQTSAAPGRRGPWVIAGVVAGLVLGVLLARGLFGGGTQVEPAKEVTQLSVVPPTQYPYVRTLWKDVAISPDGRTVVYVTTSTGSNRFSVRDAVLARRDLSSLQIDPISLETGGASPFFSPDGRFVALSSANSIVRMPLNGGPASTVCDSLSSWEAGGWTDDGQIVFADGEGNLLRVSAQGGKPQKVASVDRDQGERRFTNPLPLPGGKFVVVGALNAAREEGGSLYLVELETGARTFVTGGLRPVGFTPAGHLVYTEALSIGVQPFDPVTRTTVGERVTLLEGVAEDADLSRNGTLVYGEGGSGDRREGRFIWVTRDGTIEPFADGTLVYPRYPRFSAQGDRLVYTSGPGGNGQLWVQDIVRGGPPLNLTFEGHNTMSIFDPTGRYVAFDQSEELGAGAAFVLAADGSQLKPTRLTGVPPSANPSAWTNDGRIVFATERGTGEEADIICFSLADSTVHDIVRTQFQEGFCDLSPDERWLAYESDRSGTGEIWVQNIDQGAPLRVSPDGGADPVWAPDGSELYYQNAGALMAVSVTTQGETIELGPPVELFRDIFIPAEDFTPRSYDVHPDGRFLMVADTEIRSKTYNIVVIQNWAQEIDERIAAQN